MKFLGSAIRYWHTLRHLRPVQFYGRVWYYFARPRPDRRAAPELRAIQGRWQQPAQRNRSALGPNQFKFLGATGDVDVLGWDNPASEKLWRYNLHYFDDLNAAAADQRAIWHEKLMARWARENPAGQGTGWEPYPTSLRIVNWIKWALAGHSLPKDCHQSLAVQVRWLMKRLEWHLLGNHLFSNAKALVFAGLFFQGREAEKWLAKGLFLIERELPEQVLADGGNFERSPMYHAIFLEDILDLINLSSAYQGSLCDGSVLEWRRVAVQMLRWLHGMTHPDGQIGLFNDAAMSVAPEPRVLDQYANGLGIGLQNSVLDNQVDCEESIAIQHWEDSGYIRLSSPTAIAMLDVAPVGPDYLPGHAHADTLSFELSVFEHRVIVNGGTSSYEHGEIRYRERHTAAHSTVLIGTEASSEVWGCFRVARRAYPFSLQKNYQHGQIQVGCSHDGYTRLTGRPVHRREWIMDEYGLSVADSVTGGNHAATARYIFHPLVRICPVADNVWQLALPNQHSALMKVHLGHSKIEVARYAPEFGNVLETSCLVVNLIDGRSCVKIVWA